MILDIGPDTARRYAALIAKAGTVVWNGPVGVFEFDAFGKGTETLARAIAASNAFSIAGGGDTLAAIDKYGVADRHVVHLHRRRRVPRVSRRQGTAGGGRAESSRGRLMLYLFDLDGTLIDSERGILGCVRHALTQMHVPLPEPAALRSWIGPPLHTSFAPLLGADESRISTAIAHYHERFQATGWREYTMYPGMADVIDRLHRAGHQLAVVTSKPRGPCRAHRCQPALCCCFQPSLWPGARPQTQRKSDDDRRRAGRLCRKCRPHGHDR